MFVKKITSKLFHVFRKREKQTAYENKIDIPLNLIYKFLPTNPVIIDCGAHIGIDSIRLSDIPGSKVYSFEPVQYLYDKLLQNTEGHPNVSCFKLALSNYDGQADFYLSSGDSDASSSLLKPKEHITDHPTVKFEEVTKVDCLTLDSWAEINKVNKVDMLWLDMQGFEQSMLEASQKILSFVSVIHSEVSVKETYEGVKNYKEYKKYLESKGFKVVHEAIPENYDMGNVLFARQ